MNSITTLTCVHEAYVFYRISKITLILFLKSISCCFQFAYLVDTHTRSYLLKSHVLFLMRGLPGSGKSTLANYIARTYHATLCSADDYFLRVGVILSTA